MTMNTSLIGIMRGTSLFMRSTAATVLIAFSIMILQPTIAAAQDELNNTQTVMSTSAEEKLSKTLQRIEDKLTKLEQKLQNKQDSTIERNDLQQLKQTLDQQDIAVQQKFAQIKQHILDHQLAPIIMERHQTMVTNYQNELAALQAELEGIKNKTDNNARLTHAKNAKGRLKDKRNKRTQQPFDPNQLPNSSLKANPDNKPKQTEKEFIQAGLYSTPYTKLAALGDFTFDKLTGANNLAYLAATDEVTLTQTIKDKAIELPLKIRETEPKRSDDF